LEVEAFVRLWLADQGTPDDLVAALRSTAAAARTSLAGAAALAETYLAGDSAFPERSHLNALVAELLTAVLEAIAGHCERASVEVAGWDTTAGRGLDDVTRARLERVVDAARSGGQPLS
jgi:hypothetical protein